MVSVIGIGHRNSILWPLACVLNGILGSILGGGNIQRNGIHSEA